MEKRIAWTEGSGSITLTYTGEGNGTVSVSSDPNDLSVSRSQVLTFKGGGISRQVTVNQAAKPNRVVARLTPSTYSLSNTTYMGVTDTANMYNNTDNETYATIEHKRAYNSVYYCYIKGFDFSKIPDNATINSFTVKLKASESGNSVSTTYKPVICKGTSTYSSISTTQVINTTVKTITFSGSVSWETLKGAGTELGIRIALRRNSTMTTAYVYVYGAEIEVDYSVN